MAFFSFLDENSDITDITWRNRKRFSAIDKLSEDLMRGDSELSIGQRELIAAYVSALNGCEFCYGSHRAVAERFGIQAQLLETIVQNIDSAEIDDRFKTILHYVKKLTQTPSQLVFADVTKVRSAGWGEATLQDVICIVSLFNFFNRLLDGHGIKGSSAIYAFAGEHLSKRGYGVPWFINLIAPLIRRQKKSFLEQYSG